MLVEEAEALCCHTTLVSAEVEGSFEIVDVEDNLIVTDGYRIEVVEVRKEKSYLGGVVAHGASRISACGKRSSELDEPGLRRCVERCSVYIVFLFITVNFRFALKIRRTRFLTEGVGSTKAIKHMLCCRFLKCVLLNFVSHRGTKM